MLHLCRTAPFVSFLVGWLVLSSLIALMMEAARTSETPVDIDLTTRKYIPEDCELHTHHREKLKSYMLN
jgi:hypothetical protein